MKTYTVYLKEDSKDIFEQAVYIPEGFSFFAFLFNLFWALYNRLWLVSGVLFLLILALDQMSRANIITSLGADIMYLGIMVYLGFMGRDLIRKKLEKLGYKFVDVVVAANEDDAQFKYINKLVKHRKQQEREEKEGKK